MTWKAAVADKVYRFESELYIWREVPGGSEYFQTFSVRRISNEKLMSVDSVPCAMRLKPEEINDFIRAIMTEGWARGIRPDGYESVTGELKATKYHLEDMRKLVSTFTDPRIVLSEKKDA